MDSPLRDLGTLRIIKGDGRGKHIGIPTLNADTATLPSDFVYGVYACTVLCDHHEFPAVLHYGPRPSFNASPSLEIHIIDAMLRVPPSTVSVTIVGKIRDVRSFPSADDLVRQIQRDIERARAMLDTA